MFIVCQLSCVIYYYKIYLNKGCNKNGLNIDGNISAACDLLEKVIELSLRPYNQVMRDENSKEQRNNNF